MRLSEIQKTIFWRVSFIVFFFAIFFLSIFLIGYRTIYNEGNSKLETYYSRYESRLLLKAIAGLHSSLSSTKQAQAIGPFDEDLLVESQSLIESAKSDFSIYVSDLYLKGDVPKERLTEEDIFLARFDEIRQLLEVQIISQKKQLSELQKISNLIKVLIDDMYLKESQIWDVEVISYHAMSEDRKRNVEILYSLVVMFILILIGITYFSYRYLKLSREMELQQEKLLISTRMRALGEMSAGVAHEINNPLTVIIGRIRSIRTELDSSSPDVPKIQQILETIDKNALRITSIVRSFKTMSKSGEQDPMEVIDLGKVVAEVKEVVDRRLIDNHIQLEVDPNLSQIIVKVRPVQIIQIFTNLVNNSIHAIKDFEHKWIKIDFVKNDNFVEIYFTDSGNGIPKENVAKLFDAFFTTKNSQEGTGLGLNITQKLLQEHGGGITYNISSPHTQFIVKLPLTSLLS